MVRCWQRSLSHVDQSDLRRNAQPPGPLPVARRLNSALCAVVPRRVGRTAAPRYDPGARAHARAALSRAHTRSTFSRSRAFMTVAHQPQISAGPWGGCPPLLTCKRGGGGVGLCCACGGECWDGCRATGRRGLLSSATQQAAYRGYASEEQLVRISCSSVHKAASSQRLPSHH
jgi:hypothetical protein